MKLGTKITIAIVCAASIGGLTEATKWLPNLAEIFTAANLLLSAVSSYFLAQETST